MLVASLIAGIQSGRRGSFTQGDVFGFFFAGEAFRDADFGAAEGFDCARGRAEEKKEKRARQATNLTNELRNG